MDHRSRTVMRGVRSRFLAPLAVAAFFVSSASWAGYALPASPSGFGGSPGSWTFTPPANAPTIGGGAPAANSPTFIRGPGPSIVGAGETGAAYRLGAGAARVLAGAVVRGTAIGALTLGVIWIAEHCIENRNGQWTRVCGPGVDDAWQSTGIDYITTWVFDTPGVYPKTWYPTKEAACMAAFPLYEAYVAATSDVFRYDYGGVSVIDICIGIRRSDGSKNGLFSLKSRPSTCPVGWYVTPAGCVQTPQPQTLTPEQVEDEMAGKPLPNILPPGVPYPLDPIAPSIWNPDTANPPNSQPLRVPQGDPQPIPNTNPQQWRQPVTRWTSSPTLRDPWRMDVQPEDLVSTDPTGIKEPTSVTTGTPKSPSDEPPDLCQTNPDILACADLDKPDVDDLENQDAGGNINPDGGWGASSAACPAPRHLTVQGHDIPIPYDLFCTYMSGLRPVIIAMAWLAAGFILIGASKGND